MRGHSIPHSYLIDMSALDPLVEAAALCVFIKSKVTKYKALQAELDALVASGPPSPPSAPLPGPSGILRPVATVATPPPPRIMVTQGRTRSGKAALQEATGVVAPFLGIAADEDNVGWLADEAVDNLDQSNVYKMLTSSVKLSS
jgi:hypothetical protein